MINIIVFSKDRPLQLHAYLESLFFWSKIKQQYVTVLFKESKAQPYEGVLSSFPGVNWITERYFLQDVLNSISPNRPFTLFGCDDVVFVHSFDINECVSLLSRHEEVLGVSLRLGLNIRPRPRRMKCLASGMMYWKWNERGMPLHWNYPMELDGTVYRTNDVLQELEGLSPTEIMNPNFLETILAQKAADKHLPRRDAMACFKKACCTVITVNRVQDTHPNSFDQKSDYTVEELFRKYQEGYRIDFRKISRMRHSKVHVDGSYLHMKKEAKGL